MLTFFNDVDMVMQSLASKRPLFHSEADFQHSLAWELHCIVPTAEIRLEYPVRKISARNHIDIFIKHMSEFYAVELKYGTRQLKDIVSGEQFELVDQAAQDITRYDFVKDIERVESFVDYGLCKAGVAIMLTNDQGYWNTSHMNTVDAAFRIHDGREIGGTLSWTDRAGAGTTKGREKPLNLRLNYKINWQSYSKLNSMRYGEFKYCLIRVES